MYALVILVQCTVGTRRVQLTSYYILGKHGITKITKPLLEQ